ncbi:Bacteroides conjugative transposon TraM protein [Chitinophaga costaii]|uniref:Bacteroides conjugative transposon TraM protein n=1 Tax=Chitinophaga costaii TaxID=1335309 RepID=A0A1C4EWA3_9BACT|nr:conjugative transposon protein TraM [Chitinophaga costaii]PUZ21599.1 conjugative transposon protein TraM [Chitinophaga costaii]SCC47928.1 Bacteroides conjugative transposon TraM protein [Chitinophaga costaii]
MTDDDVKKGPDTKLIVLGPLVLFPFVCLLFWALGGGQGVQAQQPVTANGDLNASLPDASFKDQVDKLSLYDLAARDSARLIELKDQEGRSDSLFAPEGERSTTLPSVSDVSVNGPVDHAAVAEQKLQALQAQLAAAAVPPPPPVPPVLPVIDATSDSSTVMVEQMMNNSANDQISDPEIGQLSALLDKVYAIQHPGEVKDSLARRNKLLAEKVFQVLKAPGREAEQREGGHGFYSYKAPVDTATKNTISAAIYQDQTATENGTVTLMVMEDMYVSQLHVPKGSFVSAHASIGSGRLHLTITSLIVGRTIVPVRMSVYDLDGEEGINAPNSAVRDQTKESSSVIDDIGMSSLDPSLAAQATSAGIETAKSFLRKRVRLVKVPLYAGYPVLLMNNQ